MKAFARRHPLISFYVLAYALTWTIAAPLLLARRGFIDAEPSHLLEPLAAFGPFAAAMLVARAMEGRAGPRRILASLAHWRVGPVWGLFSWLSPVAILAVTLALAWGSRPAGLGEPLFTTASLLNLVIAGAILQAWGEEPGWRGLAMPLLRRRFGPLLATLALWPVWLCWHLPAFLGRPEFAFAQWIGFSFGILSAAVWLTLIWDKTESVLMCVIWHAVVNICRGIALAWSPAAFMQFNVVVLGSALLIVAYWVWDRRRSPQIREGYFT